MNETLIGRASRPHLYVKQNPRFDHALIVLCCTGDDVMRAQVDVGVPDDGDYSCGRVTLYTLNPQTTRYNDSWARDLVFRLLTEERALKLRR